MTDDHDRRLLHDAERIARELEALRVEVKRLNNHRFIRQLNSPWQMLAMTFVRGMMVGLGTVVGATLLVSVIAYLLAQIDYIPILGEWASEIAREIKVRN